MIVSDIQANKLSIGILGTKGQGTIEVSTVVIREIPPEIVTKAEKDMYVDESAVDKKGSPYL